MFKKIATIILTVTMMLCVIPVRSVKAESLGDYVVNNGVLVSYNGNGGTVVIPDNLGITSIGENAFAFNSSITNVTIPVGVIGIGQGAFTMCSNLKGVTIPDSVLTIGGAAFAMCDLSETLKIPKNVISIGQEAFEMCTGLKEVVFYGDAPTIGNNIFNYCTGLNKIYKIKGRTGYTDKWADKETETIMLGDPTMNHEIDIYDILAIQRHMLGTPVLVGKELIAADITCDNKVDDDDILKIRRIILGEEKAD